MVENFIKDVEILMSWNCGKVELINENNLNVINIVKVKKHTHYFHYTGLDGLSICHEMQKDIRELGYDCTVRVILNNVRNIDHEYLLCVNL